MSEPIRLTPDKVKEVIREIDSSREGHLSHDELIEYMMGENPSAADHIETCNLCRADVDLLSNEREWLHSPEGLAQLEQMREEVRKKREENPSE